MRRLLLLLLPLALLCACTTAPAEQADAPFSFYYRCAEVAYGGEDGVIRAEAAPLEADADLRTVVLQYLKGPASPELRTPLPADWALESIGLTEGTAELVFSGIPCRSLDRTILNACLARTLLQLPGVQRVSILRSGDGAADVLAAKLETTPRGLRSLIMKARDAGEIILYAPGGYGGYFLPSDDPETAQKEMAAFYHVQAARCKHGLKSIAPVARKLGIPLGQMDLDNYL